jgi:hypothetical protein
MQAETINAWQQTGLALGYTKGAEIVEKVYSKSGYRGALRQGAKWMEDETAGGNYDSPASMRKFTSFLAITMRHSIDLRRHTKNAIAFWRSWL